MTTKPRPASVWPGRPRSSEPAPRRSAPAKTVAAPAPQGDPAAEVRLSKRMSELGLASRREADDWIERGWVLLDGAPAVLGTKVAGNLPASRIVIRKAAQHRQAAQVTILLHKPVGYVSAQAEHGYTPAVALIKAENRWAECEAPQPFSPAHLRHLAVAGRLDIDSTGLLVLTQDGRIARQLIGEDSAVEKEYLVRVSLTDAPARNGAEEDVQAAFPESRLALLRHGLKLDDQPLRPAQVEWINPQQLRFVLREGKKRQIRRMCELVGLRVTGLKRVRIGGLRLGALPLGQWRYLREDEGF
ncbi:MULTISPECIES: pseudouridine synthase [unclassified Thiomonas]|uniref:pseudouridine synthase n=1 Tax=unclassified Thiomonas TaxID=2625466 RepID=UPI000AF5C006|nr:MULTISPECIES: pseudouridine synthase [unclassified Thiomonas]OZB71115.1 MAG: RNA-binding protein [Thiomonas sp. 13-64-67]